MGRKWIRLKPGTYIRRTSDGQWEGKRVERIDKTTRRNYELQRVSKRKPSLCDTNTEIGRMIASYPYSVEAEIVEKCGFDPEKHLAYLRDHPEWCTTSRCNLGAPPKRIFFGPPSRQYQENYCRIFPERSKDG